MDPRILGCHSLGGFEGSLGSFSLGVMWIVRGSFGIILGGTKGISTCSSGLVKGMLRFFTSLGTIE